MNENETNAISKMSIKVIGGGVYLKNKPQTITITWEIKDENGNIITPDTLSVNNIPLDPTTTSKTYHRVFSDVDFTVRAVKDGVLAIGTTTARFVGPTQTVEDSLTSNSRSIAASANSVRLLNEKIENNSSFKGLFTSLDDLKKKLRSGNNGDWAIVGEGIPAPIYIWNKNGWEATGGQYTGSTIDLDNYYTKDNVADYTDDYNVSKNHSHIVKIYDLVNWKVVERKPDAPVFQLGQSYDAGEVVNMTDDNDSSYECLQATITAPYLNQEVRSFTLAEAISFLPEDLRVTGQKISFLSSELNAWMTYVFTGGDYTNPTYWEIFTNNIDPDTNQKIADLQAKDEDLQNQINEDVTNLNNHIAESDAKFEEIDNTLTEHEDRMDDIEDEILLSSIEAACAPKDVEILADRAYKDHLGNIIADEYITRDTLTEEIIDITNQQVTDLKPGSVQPEDLSEAVKQMIGCKKITNLPDEEDITVTEDNTLKFKDREYSPKDYSGMGKKILRKHYIDGINTLTQHMINKPNTIYVIRYDYCLQGQTIEIPEGCVLEFDGGSLRNGEIVGNNTVIGSSDIPIFAINLDLKGKWNAIFKAKWFDVKGDGITDDTKSLQKAINTCQNIGSILKLDNKTYRITNTIYLDSHAWIEGVSYDSWASSNRTTILADFNNKDCWVFDTNNLDEDGNHLHYLEYLNGYGMNSKDVSYSGGTNIVLKNITIRAKEVIYGGCRFSNYPRSLREGVSVLNCKIGFASYGSFGSNDLNNHTISHWYGVIIGKDCHDFNIKGAYINKYTDIKLPINENQIPTIITTASLSNIVKELSTNTAGLLMMNSWGTSVMQVDTEVFDIGRCFFDISITDIGSYIERFSKYAILVAGNESTRVVLSTVECLDNKEAEATLKTYSTPYISLVNTQTNTISGSWGSCITDLSSSAPLSPYVANTRIAASLYYVLPGGGTSSRVYYNTLDAALRSATYPYYMGKDIVIQFEDENINNITDKYIFYNRNITFRRDTKAKIHFSNSDGYTDQIRCYGNCNIYLENIDITTDEINYNDEQDKALFYFYNGKSSLSIVNSVIDLSNTTFVNLMNSTDVTFLLNNVTINGDEDSAFSNDYNNVDLLGQFVHFSSINVTFNIPNKNLFGHRNVDWRGSLVYISDPEYSINNDSILNSDNFSSKGITIFNNNANTLSVWNGNNWIDLDYHHKDAKIVGDSSQRPKSSLINIGSNYFDTTLNKPIWWTGSNWVDATGTTV